MKKYIILSLLVISPNLMHAMKNDSLIPSSFSLPFAIPLQCSPNSSSESESVLNFRKNVQDFEVQLKLYNSLETKKIYFSSPTTQEVCSFGPSDCMKFMQYCYEKKEYPHYFTNSNKTLPTQTIDGYSVLAAVMIEKKLSLNEMLNFILLLEDCGFNGTKKDRDLEKALFHNRIKREEIPAHLSSPPSIKEFQVLEIDGYSVLAATMLAEVSLEKKRTLIQELLTCGIKPTEKDRKLAELIEQDEAQNETAETSLLNKIRLLPVIDKLDFDPLECNNIT